MRRYLLIHGDEQTARETLVAHMTRHKGVAHLVTGSTRVVEIHGARFDPNRIFSSEGARKSLARLNPGMSAESAEKALSYLDRRRGDLLRALLPPRGGLLIAVHNNASGYSVKSEAPISNRVSLPRPDSPHEFFLATHPEDFAILAQGPYNCVLQSDAGGDDDGSLSRLCARLGVRYVNLEVGLGKRDVQAEMLEWLDRQLPETVASRRDAQKQGAAGLNADGDAPNQLRAGHARRGTALGGHGIDAVLLNGEPFGEFV
jgi:hypothetical protein